MQFMTRDEQELLNKLLILENGVLVLESKNASKIYVLKTNIEIVTYLYNKYLICQKI